MEKSFILLVDDNPKNLQVLGNLLEGTYKTAVAENGVEALEFVKKRMPDVILLDVMMPEMDGYEVCERLKADPATKDIPVIFLTAKTETEDIVKGFETGAVDYVTKPFNAAELLARVQTHLELKRARKEIEEQNKELLEAARLREDVERITRHDLKNPLNAIIGFPRFIMMNEHLTETQLKFLKNIEESGYRMLKMINLSLDLFKMERGIYQLQPVPVNIILVIDKIAAEMHNLMQSANLSLQVLWDGDPVGEKDRFAVWGEELLCYSMLANLIKNALEASPERECVTVTLAEEDEAILQIHNKGTVPEHIQNRFFEKYVTSGEKTKGTGLGTYSAKLIAETQNGSISMITSKQDGTTVTICLPKGAMVNEACVRREAMPRHREKQQPIIPAPQEELAVLYDLAMNGDIAELRAQIPKIEALHPKFAPFAARLGQLAGEFQVSKIQEYLKRYMEKELSVGG